MSAGTAWRDGLGALPVDVEEHVAPLGQPLLHRAARRTVAVFVHLRRLQELPASRHHLELIHRREQIFPAMRLTLAGRARGGGDGEGEIRLARNQLAGE